jgi:membrane protein implicated in regulation of membrane protease activity
MIILALTLALFLLLAIVAAVQIVRLLKTINKITDKAERIIETAENVGEVFKNAAGPLALAKIVGNIVHAVNKVTKRGK